MRRRLSTVGAALMLAVAGLQAQWVTIRLPNTPRTADGKPNLNAPAPRLPDGKVDFSGIWYPDLARTDPTASREGQTLGEDPVIRIVTDDGSPLPLLPTAEAAAKARQERGQLGASAHCLPNGIVAGLLVPSPFKIVHAPGLTLVLFEEFTLFQQVFTDGRRFPTDMQPAWLGYSVGGWEKNDLVVETRGFNNRTGLGVGGGILTTESLHLIERFRRPNFGSLQLQVTVEDPATFSRTWTSKPVWFKLIADTEFIENICENEKDVDRIRAGTVPPK